MPLNRSTYLSICIYTYIYTGREGGREEERGGGGGERDRQSEGAREVAAGYLDLLVAMHLSSVCVCVYNGNSVHANVHTQMNRETLCIRQHAGMRA